MNFIVHNLNPTGIVTKNTKITFRSRSSRIIWLVQISTEMWDYTSPYESENETTESETNGDGPRMGENNAGGTCEIYFDKFVGFMHQIFEKWNELEVCRWKTTFMKILSDSRRMCLCLEYLLLVFCALFVCRLRTH